jgi:hypothetical protein
MRVIVALSLACFVYACNSGTPFPTSPTTTTPSNGSFPPAPGVGSATPTLRGVSLSGVVYELTPTGRVPIAGAIVYCEPCGEATHTFAYADENGFYHFSGDLAKGGGVWVVAGVPTPVAVGPYNRDFQDPPVFAGRPGWREVRIDADTTFDIELVRRSRGADET